MKEKICIVGAGLSGLAAAINLEEAGYSPVICEATSAAGGRVKTDLVEGYQLDHGFQVLLDAYPKAQEYFDYGELELQRLLPGAVLYTEGKDRTLGDPTRYFPFLRPTLESGVAGLRDLYLLWSLHREVQGRSVDEIFEQEERTTMDFLRQRGFSQKIIDLFFKPFFTGIFLEPDLSTSSRMFCFVFKMFGKGYAAIPRGGMSALPEQLLKRLKKTAVHYNAPVEKVEGGTVTLKDGSTIEADLVLIATDPKGLLADVQTEKLTWHGCDTLYFETAERRIQKPMIGLVAKPDALINNIFYPTSIGTRSKGNKELLSVTIVKEHDLDERTLISRVEEELKAICKIDGVRFIKRYHIRKALPVLNFANADGKGFREGIGGKVFLAGDHLLYGSSNAALLSGEAAARAVLQALEAGK